MDSLVKIYDFSLPVGGIIEFPLLNGLELFSYRIDSVDIVQAGDLSLIRQRVRYVESNGQPSDYTFEILEKAGWIGSSINSSAPNSCSYIFMDEYRCNGSLDGTNLNFNCFASAMGNFHPFSSPCAVVSTIDNIEYDFQVFPNPSAVYFEIQAGENTPSIKALTLVDPAGRKMRIWGKSEFVYSLIGLPNGLYYVLAHFDNGMLKVEKLIISN